MNAHGIARAAAQRPSTLAGVPTEHVHEALGGEGLWFDIGAAVLRVQGHAPALAPQLQTVYGQFPFIDRADWADVHCRIDPARGLRRWLRPQVLLWADGSIQFEPFPADSPLPLMEWGCNWLIGQHLNDLLLLHAGTLERDGRALILPALPGSGKSTLSAALAQRGWRLLSDEFGAYDLQHDTFRAVLKPVALKNESIDVMRRFAPQAIMGPVFPKTRKGSVAHLAASADAVARRHECARPGAIVLPRWQAGSPTVWRELPPHAAFSSLAFNAFNYQLLGAAGLDAVLAIARACPAWELVYSDLDDALRTIDTHWYGVAQAACA